MQVDEVFISCHMFQQWVQILVYNHLIKISDHPKKIKAYNCNFFTINITNTRTKQGKSSQKSRLGIISLPRAPLIKCNTAAPITK